MLEQPDQPAAMLEQPASVSDEADVECDSMSEVVGGSSVVSDQECYQPDVTTHKPHQLAAPAQQAEMPLLPGATQLPASHSLPVPQLQARLSQLPACLSLPEAQTEQLQLHMAAAAATTSQLAPVVEAPCAYDLPDDLDWSQSPSNTHGLPHDLDLYGSAHAPACNVELPRLLLIYSSRIDQSCVCVCHVSTGAVRCLRPSQHC